MFSGKKEGRNREPAVAGKFYPAEKEQLTQEVNSCFREAAPLQAELGNPQALISPHAGYVFSGKVAASAFNQIPEGFRPNRVFVLASSHQMHFGGASVYCAGDYETPLGTIPVDRQLAQILATSGNLFSDRTDAHQFEHSLEVQLPFLQKKLGGDFKLVPIILGVQRAEECRQIAEALRPWFVPENLFVVSSDFSHYPSYHEAVKTDRTTTEAILSNSPENLLKTLEKNRQAKVPGLVTSLCGWTSVLTLLYLTEGKKYRFRWVGYQNSGDQPLYGEHNRVVGYSAIAVFSPEEERFTLSEEEKQQLLQLAEATVKETVVSGRRKEFVGDRFTGNLAEKAGAFVSIYVDGKLRGCIGSFAGDFSLAEVVNRAAASAVNDRRFEPLSEEELDRLSIEISVLTPLKQIDSPGDIELGRHGIYIRKGYMSGTFLPQVAEKYGWTLEEFLGRCSRDKAGLGWNGWKSAELYTYEAIIFSSSKPNES